MAKLADPTLRFATDFPPEPELETGKDTGFATDYYSGEQLAALSPAVVSGILKNYANQPAQGSFPPQRKNNTIVLDSNDSNYLETFGNPNPGGVPSGRSEGDYLRDEGWLLLRTPPKFPYTFAILTNCLSQGLQHAFVRHWDQFENHIPELKRVFGQLSPHIQNHLTSIAQQPTPYQAKQAIETLRNFLDGLRASDRIGYVDVKATFLKAQMLIFKYLQKNVNANSYLGEDVNGKSQVQVYFDVMDTNGIRKILVLGASVEMYQPVAEFSDRRPIRTVTTVFMKSRSQNIKITKCFQ